MFNQHTLNEEFSKLFVLYIFVYDEILYDQAPQLSCFAKINYI